MIDTVSFMANNSLLYENVRIVQIGKGPFELNLLLKVGPRSLRVLSS